MGHRPGILLLVTALSAPLLAAPPLSPCEALGAADAVLVGEIEPKTVRRVLEQELGSPFEMAFSPVRVIRAFHGVSTPRVYFVRAGLEHLVAGQPYLIYGRSYLEGTDMFMSSDAYGTRRIEDASADLAFLDIATTQPLGASITGLLQVDESSSPNLNPAFTPLGDVEVRLTSNQRVVATTRTEIDGVFFFAGLPAATYVASAALPPDLALSDDPPPQLRLQNRGCGSLRLRVVPNGHIRGVMRTLDGRPASFQNVSLLDAELKPGEPDAYSQSVQTDRDGRYAFERVRPGQYIVARLRYRTDDIALPTMYFPGVSTRDSATHIVVGRSAEVLLDDFQLPPEPTPK